MALLVVLSWLVLACIAARGSIANAAPASRSVARPDGTKRPLIEERHTWGQLTVTPIVISPPLEYLPPNWGPIQPLRWYFEDTTRAQLEKFLVAAGLSNADAARLLLSARSDGQSLVIEPEPQRVRDLAPDVRAAIYLQLAKSPRNDRQRNAFRFYASSGDAWLAGAPISPRTRQLVQPLIYKMGNFVYFADIDLIRPEMADAAERQRLAKRLLREATMLVKLRIDEDQVAAAVEYWGRGGRRTDIRPLLESIGSGGEDHSIDIIHLLPGLPREHLYRYPRVTLADLEKPGLADCFWTALNFFNSEPDDRYLKTDYAIERLKRDYFIVQDELQLGDIAAFVTPAGGIFHVAVYLADGLVFGKNGTSPVSPWTILPIDRLRDYYPEHADHWQVVFYRRKEL